MLKEERLAARVIKRYKLRPPVDVKTLLEKYATVYFRHIPINNVDGISVDIKIPGKQPKVIVNADQPNTRMNFTMAHELGHVLIPWHMGTMADSLKYSAIIHPDLLHEWGYKEQEGEANRFASELLMPREWVWKQESEIKNLSDLHKKIADTCQVSMMASSFRMLDILNQRAIMCLCDSDANVITSGRTQSCYAYPPGRGDKVRKNQFTEAETYIRLAHSENQVYHWWGFTNNQKLEANLSGKEWRELLKQILKETVAKENLDATKRALSGIIGSANSSLKKRGNYNQASLVSAIRQRLDGDEIGKLMEHPLFSEFLVARVAEMVKRNSV